MNSKKLLLLIALLLGSLALLTAFSPKSNQPVQNEGLAANYPLDGCTVIIVGKKASTDGSVMATHTCDCGVCDWTWRYVPAADHKPGEMRKVYHIDQFKAFPPEMGLKWELIKKNETGVELPQPAHTYGYLHGAFGYMND
ncbi:MAG: hypothetical protein ACE5GI_09110, partial [Candidatus Aminicenantales bacterium]